MNQEHDPLAQAMRNLDPAVNRNYGQPDSPDLALLERVMSAPIEGYSPQTKRHSWTSFSLAASLIAFLVLAVGTFILWPTQSTVSAATPHLLEEAELDGEATLMLKSIGESWLQQEGERKSTSVRFQFWALEFNEDEPPQQIDPQEVVIHTDTNGRTVLETRALGSFDSEGTRLTGPHALVPGEVLSRMEFGPGEFPHVFEDPTTVSNWAAYLRQGAGLTENATAGEYFAAIGDLLNERKLTPEQQAGIVTMLAKLPGIKLDGRVTDRLGRSGVSFSTTTREPGEVKDVLVVSAELGILSYENVFIGSSRTDIQAPAVIEYTAWQ